MFAIVVVSIVVGIDANNTVADHHSNKLRADKSVDHTKVLGLWFYIGCFLIVWVVGRRYVESFDKKRI